MKRQSSEFLFNCINIFLCAFIVIAVVYPVYFVVIASISNPSSVANGNVWLYPKGFTMMGYQEIMKDARIWVGYKNTLIYAIGGMLVSMFFTMPAAYALSRKDFKARGFLMLFFTFTIFCGSPFSRKIFRVIPICSNHAHSCEQTSFGSPVEWNFILFVVFIRVLLLERF